MSNAKINNLVMSHKLISDQISQPALRVVLETLQSVTEHQVPGDVVEFGCYVGTTSLFLRRLLNTLSEPQVRQLYAYDSFEGLPQKSSADSNAAGVDFQAGELQVSKKQLLRAFQQANLQPPITHKAWFSDLRSEQLPEHIAFAFLDGDFYQSIFDSLRLVWPRLSPGGVITVDDYDRETLPGVKRAVDTFFSDKAVHIHHQYNIAIIRQL